MENGWECITSRMNLDEGLEVGSSSNRSRSKGKRHETNQANINGVLEEQIVLISVKPVLPTCQS